MERQPEIHFEFGTHSAKPGYYSGLEGFRKSILRPLLMNRTGTVLVVMEFTNHPKEDGEKILAQINKGVLPSKALAESFENHVRGRLSPEDFEHWQQHKDHDGYYTTYRNILDEAQTVFPGRVALLPEWAPLEEINHGGFAVMREGLSRFGCLVHHEKNYREAYQVFKEIVINGGESSRKREGRILEDIKQRISSDPEVIAVSGFFGAGHTGMYIDLRKEGFNVSRNFPDKEGGVFSFGGRFMDGWRYVRFFPERQIPEKKWIEAFERITGVRVIREVIT